MGCTPYRTASGTPTALSAAARRRPPAGSRPRRRTCAANPHRTARPAARRGTAPGRWGTNCSPAACSVPASSSFSRRTSARCSKQAAFTVAISVSRSAGVSRSSARGGCRGTRTRPTCGWSATDSAAPRTSWRNRCRPAGSPTRRRHASAAPNRSRPTGSRSATRRSSRNSEVQSGLGGTRILKPARSRRGGDRPGRGRGLPEAVIPRRGRRRPGSPCRKRR